jgi:hypothetical protein
MLLLAALQLNFILAAQNGYRQDILPEIFAEAERNDKLKMAYVNNKQVWYANIWLRDMVVYCHILLK